MIARVASLAMGPLVIALAHAPQAGCKSATSPEPAVVVAPEAVEPDPCDELADRLCKGLELGDCAELRELFQRQEIPTSECDASKETFDALANNPELPPEAIPAAYANVLVEVLRKSPKNTPEQLAQLEQLGAGSRRPSSVAELPAHSPFLECPAGATIRAHGLDPRWTTTTCERADGTAHGPETEWSRSGVPLRVVQREDGRAIEVRYPQLGKPPEQGGISALPLDLFECAEGLTRQSSSLHGVDEISCVDQQGRRQGTSLSWSPSGLVTKVAIHVDGEATFVGVANIDVSPETVEALDRIRIAFDEGSDPTALEEVLRMLEGFLAAHPDHPEALALLADVQIQRGNLDAALSTAQRCTEVFPTMGFCWLFIGVIRQAKEEHEAAREGFTRYLQHDPGGRYAPDAHRALERLR